MKNIIMLMVLFVAIASCSPLKYELYNPNTSTTENYRTFVVLNNCEEGQDIITQNQQDQVDVAFSNKLKAKGLSPEKHQIADLIVSYYVKTNFYEVEDICFDDYEDYLLGPICRAKVRTYKVNALVIDFFDTELNAIVFHGAVEGLDYHDPSRFSKELEKAVDKMIVKFDSKKITPVGA